jgi:DNA-binding NarL/FixJ family response regulator
MGLEDAGILSSMGATPMRSAFDVPDTEVSLGDFWLPLVRGERLVVEHTFSSQRCHVVLRRWCGPKASLTFAQRELLRRLVLGQPQKAVALELGTSAAAVTQRAQRCLRRLGLRCRLSLMPLFAVTAGMVHHRSSQVDVVARVSLRRVQVEELDVVSFPRPDAALPRELSNAEQKVTRLLIEGRSQAEIADRRGTTPRTVANQLGAVFAKLHVSGRVELIRYLLMTPSYPRSSFDV